MDFTVFASTANVFQGVLALVDTALMQTQQFFREYLHGDLTVKVLSLGSFVLSLDSLRYPHITIK